MSNVTLQEIAEAIHIGYKPGIDGIKFFFQDDEILTTKAMMDALEYGPLLDRCDLDHGWVEGAVDVIKSLYEVTEEYVEEIHRAQS